MQVLMVVFIAIIGAVVGSFLNVVILRYNTGMGFTMGRSKCFSCGKALRWFEFLPVRALLCFVNIRVKYRNETGFPHF